MGRRHLPEPPWKFPVAASDVPETGKRVELVADAATRAAIADLAGVVGVPRLEAQFDLTRHGLEGLRVVGRVAATVEQHCVVTLEPMQSGIEETVDLVFMASPKQPADRSDAERIHTLYEHETQALDHGAVDLGAVATEFTLLAIDPYPRKAGAVFDVAPADEPHARPFAALGTLKKDFRRKGT